MKHEHVLFFTQAEDLFDLDSAIPAALDQSLSLAEMGDSVLMLITRAEAEDGEKILVMILELGNITKLKRGLPIEKNLNAFFPELPFPLKLVMFLTPDIEWLAEQLKQGPLDMDRFVNVLNASLLRPDINRDSEIAEALRKHVPPDGSQV